MGPIEGAGDTPHLGGFIVSSARQAPFYPHAGKEAFPRRHGRGVVCGCIHGINTAPLPSSGSLDTHSTAEACGQEIGRDGHRALV